MSNDLQQGNFFFRMLKKGQEFIIPLKNLTVNMFGLGTSSGVDSLGLGLGSVASGDYSVTLGHNSKAEADNSLTALDEAETLGINSVAVGKNAKAGVRNVDTSGSAEYYSQAAYTYPMSLMPFTIGGTEYIIYSLNKNATVTVTCVDKTFEVKNDTGSKTLLAITTQNSSVSTESPYNAVKLVDSDVYQIYSTIITKMSSIPGMAVQVPYRVLLLNNAYSTMSSSDDSSIAMLALMPDYSRNNAENSIAMMENALTTGKNSFSAGRSAIAATYGSSNPAISIGDYSFSINGLSIGPYAYSKDSVSIGARSTSSNHGLAVGEESSAKNFGIALGYSAKALHDNSVAIGKYAETARNGQTVIGKNATDSDAAHIVGYNGTNLYKINPNGEMFIMKDGELVSLHTLLGISPTAPAQE